MGNIKHAFSEFSGNDLLSLLSLIILLGLELYEIRPVCSALIPTLDGQV